MAIDTTYQLQPGESIQTYNTRIAAYNASKTPQTGSIVPTTQPATQNNPQAVPPPQTNPTPQQTPTQSNVPPPPQVNLSTGSTDKTDVTALQNWLISMGYSIPAGATGTYGSQTTAAVEKLQKDLGMNLTAGQGSFGPQTQAALAKKYQGIFTATQGTQVPQDQSAAISTINGLSQTSTDPVFGNLVSSMAPILQSLGQVMSNINNPAMTGVSLQQEYNDMASKMGLPAMQGQLVNMQNIMNGTEDDIRQEISSVGGSATESQVAAMSAARNKVLMKQYNSLSTTYSALTTNLQNAMQFAAQDQQTKFQQQQLSASVAESIASIEQQMVSMGQTMQKNASDNLNKVVSNVGYQGLAAQAQGNPQMLSYYESLLGLSPGALSNPTSLKQLETFRQQTIALGQQKVNIQMYNAGLTNGGGPTNTPGGFIKQPSTGTSALVSLNANGNDSQGRPYSFTATQAQSLLSNGASVDPGTNNIVVPNVGYYISQPDGSYRLSIDPNSSEGTYIQYRNRAENPAPWEPAGSLSNQRMTRNSLTRQVNAALSQYTDSALYKNVSNGAVYLSRIGAAMTNPGSVSDLELADAIIKLNNGGGQVTEAQINTYFQGQSFADKFAVTEGKVNGKGGVLSPQQRQDLASLAQETFNHYRSDYQNLYVQAMKNLDNQGVPDAFWGNMPDFTSFMNVQ